MFHQGFKVMSTRHLLNLSPQCTLKLDLEIKVDLGRRFCHFVTLFKSSTGHIFMYNVTDAVWVISYLNWSWTPKGTTVAAKKLSFSDTPCHGRLLYMIFGPSIGNLVIWVGLSMKCSIKNVLKFRELLVMKVSAEGYPYPCIGTK